MNYDAGNNSTYYYKDSDGKLAMGPLWDYDNCLDNYSLSASDYGSIPFASQPWFEKLVQDSAFQKKIVSRYKELRETLLSDENIDTFIDETMAYLGNARERDYARWKEAYEADHLLLEVENADGVIINRNAGDVEGEIQRVKDIIAIHSEWLDHNLENTLGQYTSEKINQARTIDKTGIEVVAVLVFIIMIILLTRYMKGEYR